MIDVKGKGVLVMGLGLHGGGVATVKWLVKHGAKVTITDLRGRIILQPSLEKLQGLPVQYVLGKHRTADFQKADMVVQNPGVPNDSPYLAIAKKFGARIVNEATLFFENVKSFHIIGVTGTKGKSTTSTLIHSILRLRQPKALLAGNIRTTAMLDILDRVKPGTPVVLELSSWQLEGLFDIRTSPHIAVMTNIYEDHLNRYGSLREYIRAKERIIAYQGERDCAVLNFDQPVLRAIGKAHAKRGKQVIWFSRKREVDGAYIQKGWVCVRDGAKGAKILPLSDARIPGDHNMENVLASVAVAKLLHVPNAMIRKAIRRFRGVTGRLEYIGSIKGVRYYNDTTATAPDATIAALKALSALVSSKTKNLILIAGGLDKDLAYVEMAKEIRRNIKALILFPGTATAKLLSAGTGSVNVFRAQSMRAAVRIASKISAKGDIVLLSPGAASFGLFLHEFDRGDQFVAEVKAL